MLSELTDKFVFDAIKTKLSVTESLCDEHHKTGPYNCDISRCVL